MRLQDTLAQSAIRPKRIQDDEFFDRGNDLCHKSTSDMILSYRMVVTEQEEGEDEENNKDDSSPRFYSCCVPHCHETFDSISAQEEHYEKNHIHECHECKSVFPNEFLLDLHLQETHDAYYQTLLQHGKATYPCLVQSCHETFTTLQQRMSHLQSMHGYPKWFRFEHKSCPSSNAKPACRNVSKRRHKTGKVPLHDPVIPMDLEMRVDCNSDNDNFMKGEMDLERRRRRSERRKERNKNIPCRYYHSTRGCWRGDKCMFLHERSGSDGHLDGDEVEDDEENENVDMSDNDNDDEECIITEEPRQGEKIKNENNVDIMQVEEILVNQVKKSLKITVPAKISFGRKR